MKIITLVGKSNCGKTATLKTLIFHILSDGGQLKYPKPPHKRKEYFLTKEKADELQSEFEQSRQTPAAKQLIRDLTAKFDYNGKVVLITSAGDTVGNIKSAYQGNRPCDVFICASHDNPDIISYLQSLGTVQFVPQADIQKTGDTTAFDHAIMERNRSVANYLLQMI